MCTPVTHAVAAVGLGKLFTGRRMPLLFWGLAVVLSILPDIDVFTFSLGIPYEHPFGHRGFTHSLFFALLAGLLTSAATYRSFGVRFLDLWGFYFVVTASHGILDALTNGGHNIAFFWPFDPDRRVALPLEWRPIQVPYIGRAFFSSETSWRVVWTELLWVWLPTALLVGLVWCYRQRRSARLDQRSP